MSYPVNKFSQSYYNTTSVQFLTPYNVSKSHAYHRLL